MAHILLTRKMVDNMNKHDTIEYDYEKATRDNKQTNRKKDKLNKSYDKTNKINDEINKIKEKKEKEKRKQWLSRRRTYDRDTKIINMKYGNDSNDDEYDEYCLARDEESRRRYEDDHHVSNDNSISSDFYDLYSNSDDDETPRNGGCGDDYDCMCNYCMFYAMHQIHIGGKWVKRTQTNCLLFNNVWYGIYPSGNMFYVSYSKS